MTTLEDKFTELVLSVDKEFTNPSSFMYKDVNRFRFEVKLAIDTYMIKKRAADKVKQN